MLYLCNKLQNNYIVIHLINRRRRKSLTEQTKKKDVILFEFDSDFCKDEDSVDDSNFNFPMSS